MDNLKSYASVWKRLATHSRQVEAADIVTFERRLYNEGLQFLTVTLPALGKDVESSLETGSLNVTARFKVDANGIPIFLRKLFRACYGPERQLNPGVRIAPHVKWLRQLCCLAYKLEVPNEEREAETLERFLEVDRTVGSMDYPDPHPASKRLIAKLLTNCDPFDIRPRHGPGATACRTPNHVKWHSFRFIPKLDRVFPYTEHFFYNSTHLSDSLDKLVDSEEVAEPSARIVCVPKDSRGPRIISCEPREFQYIQQGLMRKLYDRIESHPLTSRKVNFTDQEINRDLARVGSIDRSLATIDMKEASDRVSLELVRKLFPPRWVEAFEACRSTTTTMPDGTVVELAKFAPMGSAVCFPVEALTFWALLRPHLGPDVWVYGDDIVISNDDFEKATLILESFGLLVNVRKSLHKGFFRESCGGDFLHGFDIGYVKLRKPLASLHAGAYAEFANSVGREYGLSLTDELAHLFEDLTGVVFPRQKPGGQPVPYVIETERTAATSVFFRRRWNKSLQRHEYRIPVPGTLAVKAPAQSTHWCEMLRKELMADKYAKPGMYSNPMRTPKFGWSPLIVESY